MILSVRLARMFPSTDPQSALPRPYAVLRIFWTCNKGRDVLHCAKSVYRARVTIACTPVGQLTRYVWAAVLAVTLLVGFIASVPAFASSRTEAVARKLQVLEDFSGGRLGVALVDFRGRTLVQWRGSERFAMCSTFKAPLAGLVLASVDKRQLSLDQPVRFGAADLLEYAPVVRAHIEKGVLPVAELARAIVTVSDNSAANLLIRMAGGPQYVTAFARRLGDRVTRLDRTEPALNENASGDPRDSTSPVAMARLMRRLLSGALSPASTATLRRWLEESSTGARRIRAGLPSGWRVGDKTGTCGNAWNDVAVIRSPRGTDYLLAVYLDRATVGSERADATIAEVARLLAPRMAER